MAEDSKAFYQRTSSMNELPSPSEPWFNVYKRNNKFYNKFLVISIVILVAGTISAAKTIEFNFNPPKYIHLTKEDFKLKSE